MQALNEKNGKKCQTIDIQFTPYLKQEGVKIYEKMKGNENIESPQSP